MIRAVLVATLALGVLSQGLAETPAADQTGVISLRGWMASGLDLGAADAKGPLVLPAGAQIFRLLTESNVDLALSSRPVFGSTEDEFPVIEFGDLAIVFMQTGDAGSIVSVAGDQPPAILAREIPLSADGRAVQPLTLRLSRSGGVLRAEIDGQLRASVLQSFTPTAACPEAVLSAGRSAAWVIDTLRYSSAVNQVSNATRSPAGGSSPKAGAGVTDPTRPAGYPAAPRRTRIAAESPENHGLVPVGTEVAPTRVGTLEIFTPPSIRRNRANALRAAAATLNSN